MDYNTQREKLIMPEYGRGVQDMVDYAMTITDRRKRTQCAYTIVAVMRSMFPQQSDQPDFEHKLWDHLAIISDFKLDIDYPFEVASASKLAQRPDPLPYPMHRIRLRHYGHLLEAMLTKLSEMEAGEKRDELTMLVAEQMKRSMFTWNRDSLNDSKIVADIDRYTNGAVQIDESSLADVDCTGIAAVKPNASSHNKRAKRKY
jgi:hypothetical protein